MLLLLLLLLMQLIANMITAVHFQVRVCKTRPFHTMSVCCGAFSLQIKNVCWLVSTSNISNNKTWFNQNHDTVWGLFYVTLFVTAVILFGARVGFRKGHVFTVNFIVISSVFIQNLVPGTMYCSSVKLGDSWELSLKIYHWYPDIYILHLLNSVFH